MSPSSSIATLRPRRARPQAIAAPTSPPPITATSYSLRAPACIAASAAIMQQPTTALAPTGGWPVGARWYKAIWGSKAQEGKHAHRRARALRAASAHRHARGACARLRRIAGQDAAAMRAAFRLRPEDSAVLSQADRAGRAAACRHGGAGRDDAGAVGLARHFRLRPAVGGRRAMASAAQRMSLGIVQ